MGRRIPRADREMSMRHAAWMEVAARGSIRSNDFQTPCLSGDNGAIGPVADSDGSSEMFP